MTGHAHRLTTVLHHRPLPLRFLERQRRHGHRRRPVARLHQERAVDRRVHQFGVRMAVHDKIDAVDFARHPRRHVLGGKPRRDGIVRGRTVQPRVQQHDHHIGFALAHLGHRTAHRRHDIGHRETCLAQMVAVPQHRARRRSADDRDAHAPTIDQRVRRHERASLRVAHVGRQEGECRLGYGRTQQRHAKIEFVIAQHRRVVTHHIHRSDHRMDRRRRHLGGHIQQRIARQDVATLDQQHTARVRRAHRIHDGGGPRQRTRQVGGVGVVVPATQAPVNVGGRRNDQIEPAGLRGQSSGGQREHGHRQKQ